MAYYNGFNYGGIMPPQYSAAPQPQPQAPQQTSQGIIWVQGEAGAKSFMVAPNTTVQLWDSEAQTIYLKSADASGMPTMRILDYTIRDQNTPTTSALMRQPEYVTHDELVAFEDKIKKMIKGGNDDGEPAF